MQQMRQLRGNRFKSPQILTTEQRPVQTEGLRQVVDVSNSLVHGSGEVVGVVQAAQDDAGEVERLGEIAHQGALESDHIPPEEGGKKQIGLAQEHNRHMCLHISTVGTILKRNFRAKAAWEDVNPADNRGNSTVLMRLIFSSLIRPQQTPESPPGDSSRSLIKVARTDC